MKKKMRKFAEGGFSSAQEEWLGGADRTDPYILARMRSAVPDELAPEFETKTGENQAISKIDGIRERAMKSVATGNQKNESSKSQSNPKSAPKSSANDMPESLHGPDYKLPSLVKTISKEVTKVSPRSPSKMLQEESEYTIKPPLQEKGERLMKAAGVRTSFKSGGKVKSASSRADGCAVRGKTRA